MVEKLSVSEFLKRGATGPVLDVRSPGEFLQGHIPGAISFPLFSDPERAEVGTLYKQVGKDAAMSRGLEIVEPRMKLMYDQGIALAEGREILVHCWRGGKRSESVAWLLSHSGLKVSLLQGGYKNYRQWVLSQFNHALPIAVVGGRTGSGKTQVLHALARMGEAIIDLEALADHRGSSFGRLGSTRQVTQAQFENDLAAQIDRVKNASRIWVEDESRGIGKMVIPEPIWKLMRSNSVFYLDIPRSERVQLLLEVYGRYPVEELKAATLRIADQLGGLRTQQAIDALESGDLERVVHLTLDYYDKTYDHGLSKRDPMTIKKIFSEKWNAENLALELVKATNE